MSTPRNCADPRANKSWQPLLDAQGEGAVIRTQRETCINQTGWGAGNEQSQGEKIPPNHFPFAFLISSQILSLVQGNVVKTVDEGLCCRPHELCLERHAEDAKSSFDNHHPRVSKYTGV